MSTRPTDFSDRPLPQSNAPATPGSRPGGTARRPRWWLPVAFVLAAAAGIAAALVVPLGETEETFRTVAIYAIFTLALFLVLGWLLLVPATRWATALLLLLVVGGVSAAMSLGLMTVRFSGDMWMSAQFWWQRSHRPSADPSGLPPSDVGAFAPEDCPEYRGRHRDGVVIGPELARDWQASPPRLLWKFGLIPEGEKTTAGHSSFAVVGNVAVTLEQHGAKEAVVCYDTATGRQRWAHLYSAQFSEAMGGPGPRSTPTISGEDVYALGATGMLHCLNVKNGEVKWQVDVLEGNANVMWALSGSPLVYKNQVLVNPGVQKEGAPHGTLVAYDRATGKYAWSAGKAHAGYSSPMLAKLAGREQIVLFDGKGIAGYDPENQGKELWRHPWETNQEINVAQPLLLGDDRILVASGYTNGGNVLQVKRDGDGWSVRTLWKANSQSASYKFTSPVLWGGYVYGLSDGVLACLDPETGKAKWRGKRYGHGQVLVTNGTLLILGEQGQMALVEASPEAFRELGRIQALDESRTWNVPVLVRGRAYVRNDQEMACYDLTGR